MAGGLPCPHRRPPATCEPLPQAEQVTGSRLCWLLAAAGDAGLALAGQALLTRVNPPPRPVGSFPDPAGAERSSIRESCEELTGMMPQILMGQVPPRWGGGLAGDVVAHTRPARRRVRSHTSMPSPASSEHAARHRQRIRLSARSSGSTWPSRTRATTRPARSPARAGGSSRGEPSPFVSKRHPSWDGHQPTRRWMIGPVAPSTTTTSPTRT
jgi:hypothetical protein